MRIRGGEEKRRRVYREIEKGEASVLQTCMRFLFLGRICRVQMGWTILAFETILWRPTINDVLLGKNGCFRHGDNTKTIKKNDALFHSLFFYGFSPLSGIMCYLKSMCFSRLTFL